MVKLVAVGGLLGNFFKVRPPMGGLFPNAKQASAWINYYKNDRYDESKVQVVPYDAW